MSDRVGNTAAVELINGKFQVSSGQIMPVPILCNEPYMNNLKNLSRFTPLGGSETFNIHSQKWVERFPKAAHLIKNYDPATSGSPVSYAWNILDSIRPGQWQLVADVRNNILYFRSDIGKGIKSIDVSKCDFSNKSPLTYLDINANTQGDVAKQFSKLTPEINDEYVIKGFPIGYENAEFYSSDKYVNLKRNLHQYVADKLK